MLQINKKSSIDETIKDREKEEGAELEESKENICEI